MGQAGSQPSSFIPCASGAGCLGINENEEVRLSRGIDRGIRETRRNLANTPKILLLGAGGSGKNTIIKQMRILNNVPFTEYERELYRVQVFYNLVGGMRSLLEAMRKLAPLEEPVEPPGDPLSPGGSGSANADTGTNSNAGANPGVGVERPKPAFGLYSPPKDGRDARSRSLGSPKSEGRVELDGASTLNTNPHHHDVAHSASARTSPPSPSTTLSSPPPVTTSQVRPLSSIPNRLSPSNQHPSSSGSPPLPARRSKKDTQDPDISRCHYNEPDIITTNVNAKVDANDSPTTSPNPDPDPEIPLSRSPIRSPSLSLNIFHPGALTQRQHAALLNELHYVPDIRPGEPFPMEYEGLLRGLWWGWEGCVSANGGADTNQLDAIQLDGKQTGMTQKNTTQKDVIQKDTIQIEPGVGQYLDRIQSETGIALPDNLTYFFTSPERLSEWFRDEYMPSDEDVLRCQGRATGIQETVFTTLGNSASGLVSREMRTVAEARRLSVVKGTHGGDFGDETGTTGTIGGMGMGTTTAATASGSGSGTAHGGGHSQGGVPQLNAPLRIPMMQLHLVDVSGQRTERRKWMHCFQDVTAVLFLVGLSGYSQGMPEDPSANQMQDAMALWDGVCSSEWFWQTSLILFLNKKDLFAEKVAKFPIKNYFPDYEGGEKDVTAGMDYFKRRFLRLRAKSTGRRGKPSPVASSANTAAAPKENDREKNKGKEKEKGKGRGNTGLPQRCAVYTHFTTATDTMQLRFVMVAVCDIILRDSLAAAHLL